MWASQPPARNGWGRSGESGSPFRGSSRGRPGRGTGGRGGRGGRGGGRDGGPNSLRPDEKASKQHVDQSKDQNKKGASALTSTSSATSTSDISPSLPPKPPTRPPKEPRQPIRKPSDSKQPRKLPPIVVNSPPATSDTCPPSATTPTRSRRKRSQNKGSSSSITSKKSPSSESSSSFQRVEKSPVVIKDLPPHLAPPPPPEIPSFDIKHNIDALVERVRAVAMDRPHTPGSHIDWAGDDDDSLPDLDDWGVTTVNDKSSATLSAQADLISPILVDALKPLPNLEFGSPQAGARDAVDAEKASPAQQPIPSPYDPLKAEDSDHTPRGAPVPPQAKKEVNEQTEGATSGGGPGQKKADAPSNDREDKSEGAPRSPEKPIVPMHPSLPPKRETVTADVPKRGSRRLSIPAVKPTEPAPLEGSAKSSTFASTDAPKLAQMNEPSKDSFPEREGLAASMHAPKSSASSAPSHITTHSTPSFQLTHGRAHTIGRPSGVRVPFGHSNGPNPDGQYPEHERGSHRDRINHARTHSSPPTGPGTSTARARGPHARPIITSSALSQLARSLGGTPPPKREVAAAAKE
ncbi:hypothetical protein BN946_scf184652.g44 [Trametes cinnabarina]|uniref:Uncharacterized protein n=1 Tax=Pycnoporus cinnabarinus TaxID=5643 RepID=A0A060S2V6_PYCCI|nr:hypothetical protein BN946_scf184652.g44 [Trametes cinnabarina]